MLKVSVVIPTKNRSAMVAQAIDHVEDQTFPKDQYEVIVIDNDSVDDTRSVLESKARLYPNLKFGFQEKPGAAATRNAGLRMATGELIVFVDDDVQAEPSLIEAHFSHHQKEPGDSFIGAVTIPWGEITDPFQRYLRDHRILNPYTLSKGPIDFSYYHTCNVSTPADALAKVGGFNEAFSIYGMEDIELGYRLERSGSRMTFAPDAKATHYHFPWYEEFIGRCEEAGYSLGQLLVLHPELKKRFVESSRVTRHLKNFHPLYRGTTVALGPVFRAIAEWERRRGSVPVTRLMDVHYGYSVRYHFFLGYDGYTKDMGKSQAQRMPSIEPSLAKKVLK
jgi:glycosyltransferase involved in cell wall biosynthesis